MHVPQPAEGQFSSVVTGSTLEAACMQEMSVWSEYDGCGVGYILQVYRALQYVLFYLIHT